MYLITEQGPDTILHTAGYVNTLKQVARYVADKILNYEQLEPGSDDYKTVKDEITAAIMKTADSQIYNYELTNTQVSRNKDIRKVDGRYYQFIITRMNKL